MDDSIETLDSIFRDLPEPDSEFLAPPPAAVVASAAANSAGVAADRLRNLAAREPAERREALVLAGTLDLVLERIRAMQDRLLAEGGP